MSIFYLCLYVVFAARHVLYFSIPVKAVAGRTLQNNASGEAAVNVTRYVYKT
jgi:hypothetical protein